MRGRGGRSRALALLLPALLAVACSRPPTARQGELAPGESRTFSGWWTASGTRHTLRLEAGHQTSILSLTGSLLLVGQGGLGVGSGPRPSGCPTARPGATVVACGPTSAVTRCSAGCA